MNSNLEQLLQDQIIICKGLTLLKIYISNENNEFLSNVEILLKEEQERLPILSEIEMKKLVMLEKRLENEIHN